VKRWDRRFCVGITAHHETQRGGGGVRELSFLQLAAISGMVVNVSAFVGKESNFMLGKSCILCDSYIKNGEHHKSRPSARVRTREGHSSRL
jgi:hypothetical protein